MNANEQYPALMAYIYNRNALQSAAEWCDQLRQDERAALAGEFADVAKELKAAKADFGSYPYNADMGRFLGLELRSNNEPTHGYYMACGVQDAFELGEARRKVESAISQGKPLKIVAARDKTTRKPIRFHTFAGDQIKIVGNSVECINAKRRVRLSSSWSQASCMEAVCRAIETGQAYGA